jgi:hypothetical protein
MNAHALGILEFEGGFGGLLGREGGEEALGGDRHFRFYIMGAQGGGGAGDKSGNGGEGQDPAGGFHKRHLN